MSKNENQSKTNQRFIVTKESYWSEETGEMKVRRKTVPVDDDFYYKWYRPIWAQQKRAQTHGQCVCPKKYLWKCDGACEECEYRAAGDMLSLDYTVTDGDGNEKSWLEDVPDNESDMLSVLEDRELLEMLMRKLEELDPEGRRICELIMEGKSERESSALLGLPRNTYTYRRDKLFAQLRKSLQDYR